MDDQENKVSAETGTLKVIVRSDLMKRRERKIERVAQTVENLLKNSKEAIGIPNLEYRLSDGQLLGDEAENDERIEFTVKLAAPNLTSHFIQIISNLIEKAKHIHTPKISFVITNSSFFPFVFIPIHENLPTQDVHFGNILERYHFLCHKNVNSSPELVPMINSFMSLAGNKSVMFTTMEHDRRIINIKFPFQREIPKDTHQSNPHYRKNHYKPHQKPEMTKPFDAIVALQSSYNNFRHVIVDFERAHKGLYSMKIYFYLSWPMSVKVFRFLKRFENEKEHPPSTEDHEQEHKEVHEVSEKIEDEYCRARNGFWNNRGKRYPSWDNPKAYSKEAEAVNGSPVFMIYLKELDSKTCAEIIGRLHVATEKPIEFRNLNSVKPKLNQSIHVSSPFQDPYWMRILTEEASFSLRYLLAALLSRGNTVKDLILCDKKSKDDFMESIMNSYRKDKALTLESMERLLSEVDEKLEMSHLLHSFERIKAKMIANTELLQQIYEENKKEGYIRVRKIVITPTRYLYVAPELLMSNRVLRKHDCDGEKTLRILFRDDDGNKIYANNVSTFLIDRTVGDALRRGIQIAGKEFRFLGSSNSQLRDNGCYFFEGSKEEIAKIRRDLGQFKMQSVPKIMSRIGQCFTQAREISVELQRIQYTTTYDYIGGMDSNCKPYTFSDGVGVISRGFAENISRSLDLSGSIPSCFQIRFRGYKGVMSVDLMLDERKKWGKRYRVSDHKSEHKKWCYLDAVFRPSQMKFLAPRATLIEIVKHSSPVAVSLNKPMINIMDQVSSMQSHSRHSRITNRIHWLLDRNLHELTRYLIDEQKCRNKLNEFPKLILYYQLNDFNLTQEPFFRSLIQASSRSSLKRLLNKLQIPIPTTLGRSMFGVIDETGELQYGQVFVRYTKNAALKFPGKNAERVTHVGPILITKNPCIVPGDIRMFEAINLPGLEHLSDVVVFPRHGPRPHTDEMAGSDLDGDEYTVIWDEQLFFDRNEKAFDFTSPPLDAEEVAEEELNEKMCDFFVTYMAQDSIGKIANAFINNADQYGIESEVCKRIAIKHNKAVDFPKTGIAPKRLTNFWENNTPPERCERWADFMEKSHEPSYASTRLIGQLFRRVKVIDDSVKLMIMESEQVTIPQDPLIDYPGWERWEKEAITEYETYSAHLQSLMDSYSIKDEGELFSNCFISLKNRVSDRDQDDMSLYNTVTVIEQRLSTIFGRFRRAFFEKFGNFQALTRIDTHRTSTEHKEVFRRVCLEPTNEMKQRACAYYKIAYHQETPEKKRFLSFAWLAWDVINEFRREKLYSQVGLSAISFDPLSDRLSKHIAEFIEANSRAFKRFRAKEIEESVALKRYCLRHQGLAELLFFCYKWGRKHLLFYGPFNVEHLCLTVILFGLNKLQTENFEATVAWLEQTDEVPLSGQTPLNLNEQRGGIGRKFLLLIEFLSTRQFEKMKKIDFLEAGLDCYSFFIEREWVPLHQLALKTFNQVAFTNRFESLPCVEGLHNEHLTKKEAALVEAEPFVIEVPARLMITDEMIEKLIDKTGCVHIVTRDLHRRVSPETARLVVSSYGTIEANQKLRDLLTIRWNSNAEIDCRQKALMLAAQVYEQLNGN